MLRSDHVFKFENNLFTNQRNVDDFACAPTGCMENKIAFFHVGEKLKVAEAALKFLPIAQPHETHFVIE